GIVEGLALSLAGTAVGLLIAHAGALIITDLAPIGLMAVETSVLSWRLLTFTLATGTAGALVFSAVPAVHAARESPVRESPRTTRAIVGGGYRLTRDVLVVVQVAAALALLAGAGLMVRTLANLPPLDLGFCPVL